MMAESSAIFARPRARATDPIGAPELQRDRPGRPERGRGSRAMRRAASAPRRDAEMLAPSERERPRRACGRAEQGRRSRGPCKSAAHSPREIDSARDRTAATTQAWAVSELEEGVGRESESSDAEVVKGKSSAGLAGAVTMGSEPRSVAQIYAHAAGTDASRLAVASSRQRGVVARSIGGPGRERRSRVSARCERDMVQDELYRLQTT